MLKLLLSRQFHHFENHATKTATRSNPVRHLKDLEEA